MIVCIVGGSGSGKDTQGKLLSKKTSYPHVSVGAIIRELAAKGDAEGLRALQIVDQGKLVDADLVGKLLENYLRGVNSPNIILNGFPRSMEQMGYFPDILKRIGQKLCCVVHLRVTDDVLLQRMHQQVAEGQERGDISDEAMQGRLAFYHAEITPILEHYTAAGLLEDIDGMPSVDVVEAQIWQVLTKRGFI